MEQDIQNGHSARSGQTTKVGRMFPLCHNVVHTNRAANSQLETSASMFTVRLVYQIHTNDI